MEVSSFLEKARFSEQGEVSTYLLRHEHLQAWL